ncbi:hypothetical protein DL771_010167 [Monosporascus sp. 5C6A]|nr:hypothetical protein DL771_010167 [Monosporascus sp. 5C6A]
MEREPCEPRAGDRPAPNRSTALEGNRRTPTEYKHVIHAAAPFKLPPVSHLLEAFAKTNTATFDFLPTCLTIMEKNQAKWSKTVFRLRGLPNTTSTSKEVASLVSGMLGDTLVDNIRVCSLATTLSLLESPRSKVATVMFATAPALVRRGHNEDEWVIRGGLHFQIDLILDTHFMGMTPLSDVSPTEHLYDCIALSGLASHPFGSWQPKGGDKTFMWIRDDLPKHLQRVRAVIYGYRTKLHDSQSFQTIPDLAHEFIDQLLAYGWGCSSAKPIAFLAHSLGGLVLKEALIQLNKSQDQAYQTLIDLIQGVIFFGVPNLGMEQAHFRTIVRNNPNEALVDDIARNSNYLRRLNEAFTQGSFNTKLRCFWAFETSESLTVTVSRGIKYATDHGSRINSGSTLILDEHGETFTEQSYSTGLLPTIGNSPEQFRIDLTSKLDSFKRISSITDVEEIEFMRTTSSTIQSYMRELQAEQERTRRLMYMKRLEPFLIAMKQFEEITEALGLFIRPDEIYPSHWKQIFTASWRDFATGIEQIKESIARNKRLIENQVSFVDFEQIRTDSVMAEHTFRSQKTAQDGHRRAIVTQWLSSFNNDTEQDRNREARSICKDPGRWLLDDSRFQQWFDVKDCLTPSLWVNGIPGAGKTILASVVVDAARDIPGATVAFFYCKHGEETRNSFINSVAKEMLQTALNSCEKLYLIIDGLDECKLKERKEIASWFQTAVESLSATEMDPPRCLFVSQEDEVALQDFRDLPAIKITDENRDDLAEFAAVWHRRIEHKFGALQSNNCHVSRIISARSQGMFIFAELFAKYLEAQVNRADVLKELDPAKLPVKLDHVYERILHRVFESGADNIVAYFREILSWIVCAKRPLRWREIQAAVSIDLENQRLDYDKEISDSPKGLFASLVELQEDGTVELVHGTARECLMSRLAYLNLPQMEIGRNEEDIRSDLVRGAYAFYDYTSACWAMHLPNAVSELKAGGKLTDLQETLETFIELHWSPAHKVLQDTKRIQNSLAPMESSKHISDIIQAVAWAQKQSSRHGQGPKPDEALDLSVLTEEVRSVMERMLNSSLLGTDAQRLQHFYGKDWFKCPRVNCHHYHNGFSSAEEREQHINKHERPFLCIVSGCPTEVFGFATRNELKRHLFESHAIDMFDDTEDAGYPDPIKPKTANDTAKEAATFECSLCDKKFTRNHNLKNHMRVHEGSKPFACCICNQKFTRKADCGRHEI